MIKLTDVTVFFGEKHVLNRLSLTIPTDGATAVSGSSGCGKTTLLRVIAGLVTPASGRIEGAAGLKFGVVFQESRLLPWLTAKENIAIVSDEEAANEWLARFGLGEAGALLPKELSGGMQRRVALARALAFRPAYLLLDEPFNGLDGENVQNCARILLETGLPLLVVTHHPEEAALLHADRRIEL